MGIVELWLPILLSAVFVFIVSSIFHMVIPIHKNDYQKLSGESTVLEAMRTQGVAPGSYMFPCAGSMQEMSTPEHQEKLNQGPVGFMTVIPNGPVNMGKNLGLWFLYSVLIGVFSGYLGTLGLARGASFMDVFQLTGTAAILGYAVGAIPDSIWKGVRWSITGKFIIDGVVYGLVTGATFGWLWPAATLGQ